MLGLIISLLPALIVLGVLIFVHELGHFLVARWNGVKVEKFSIGFGPEVFGWTSRATRYAISLIPLGGFVKLAGESFDTLEGRKVQADDFISKNIFQRFLVVFAGPLMNLITGFLILVAVFCVGRPLPANVIGDFVKGYPAETSGLQKGDRILKINEKETPSWIQVTEAIVFNESENLQVLVDRNGEKLIFSVGTKEESGKELTGDHKKIRRLGIKPDMHERLIEKYGLLESIKQAFFSCSDMIRMMFYTFWKLVTFQLSVKSLSGPVQIFAVAGETRYA
jgi:regulator of sigma E protease